MDARTRYFIQSTQDILGENLQGIVETDSYLRQPDYSSRCVRHFYIILSDDFSTSCITLLRYLQAEFLEFTLNYLTISELSYYPAHCIWQFTKSPWLFQSEQINNLISLGIEKNLDTYRQAVFSVAHISRLYYLRNLTSKIHVWGVRQLGWAMRYAEFGLFRPLKSVKFEFTNKDNAHCLKELQEDLNWLITSNTSWQKTEEKFLSDINEFRGAAARLSRIAEYYSALLQHLYLETHLVLSQEKVDEIPPLQPIINPVLTYLRQAIGERLLSFYLHGSAARSDMRIGSDIDAIAIVDKVDDTILEAIRSVQLNFKDLSISIYSKSDVHQYPSFRMYALTNGTKRIYGDFALEMQSSMHDSAYGIINNLFTIRQVIRSYLISGTYGSRAHYMLGLMMKLADHGCLRPLQTLESGIYPTKKTQVLEYYKNNEIIITVVKYTQNFKENENTLKKKLLSGFRVELENLFFLLLNTCEIVAERIKMIEGNK
ncbi:nucleotidyltransferase domain-containing protein [Xenorhabdus bovienii]|uniref:nucleotidyltransferase domain-containing protein n=1 Tax=Xenorhabdus bovienii TaxID=40576 RepID=UPI0023B22E92|nr:nucleotidyltransferase domain-containing protein [Xenorhabdus bovienii]MDE9541024.1 nucleotidyltransferase domain-containing protein [Xenorhabdus bovienii]